MEGKTLDFTWTDQDGNTVTAKDLASKPYVLYFYPKDDTPGCTKEACGIRDHWDDFRKAGLDVYGVSLDNEKKHQKFIEKYDLPFALLVANEEDLTEMGVYKEKSMYGRTFMGISRETFIVVDGNVVKHYPKVKPDQHATQILEDFQSIAA